MKIFGIILIITCLVVALITVIVSAYPVTQHNITLEQPKVDGRISVLKIGTFEDDIAYHSVRGVYEILDKKTGKEYIGISGIGISEIGSHTVGGKFPQQVEDER